MNHFAAASSWVADDALPPNIRTLADRCFALLKDDSRHPSLYLKKIGRF